MRRLSETMRTQDNRATTWPLYCVQQERTIFGLMDGYTDEYMYLDDDGVLLHHDEAIAKIRESGGTIGDDDTPCDHGFEEVGIKRIFEFVGAHFTERAAQRYIDENRHNLTNPRIYVTSQHRCPEWQSMVEFIHASALVLTLLGGGHD